VAFSSYDDAVAWLEGHVDFERVAPNRASVPTLEPIRATLSFLGDPHHDYPSIHVTGTNGKGTTTTVTSALLTEIGLRVGTFTSPDLHSINERIVVAGDSVDDDSFVALLSRLADVERVSGLTLTRFELLTVAALLHFSDEGVDVAVVEVGMGGTWDSTNVIDGTVCVLTNVDLDHTAVLGETVGEIARDKVGIFRPEVPALLGTADPEVLAIARARADALGATLIAPGEGFELERNDVAVGGRLVTVRTPFAHYEDVLVSLHGLHQGDNVATAVMAAELFLGRPLGEEVLRRSLAHVTMPGRLEIVKRRPMIVVDGAHNPAGMRALAGALEGAFHVDGRRRAVLGMLTGRNVDDMVAPLVAVGVTEFDVAAPRSPRAVEAEVVAESSPASGRVGDDTLVGRDGVGARS
jgi:dihydrofolate synthase/folylpolyglutamate synthase